MHFLHQSMKMHILRKNNPKNFQLNILKYSKIFAFYHETIISPLIQIILQLVTLFQQTLLTLNIIEPFVQCKKLLLVYLRRFLNFFFDVPKSKFLHSNKFKYHQKFWRGIFNLILTTNFITPRQGIFWHNLRC